MSKIHALLIFIILVCATGAVFYVAWYFTLSGIPLDKISADNWKNFYSLVGVGVAAVSGAMGVWMSFRNLGVQAKASAELERLKKMLERSVPAYGILFAAAGRYYRSLAPLETGGLNLELIEVAEDRMKEAESEILFVSDEYEKCWNDFWHTARQGKEKANRDAHTTDAKKLLWRELSKELAQNLKRMKKIAQDTIKR